MGSTDPTLDMDVNARLNRPSTKSMLLNPDGSDITFIVGEELIPGHKTVLVAGSTYFRTLCSGELKDSPRTEITLKDVSPDTFKAILEFIYVGRLPLGSYDSKFLLDLLQLSRDFALSLLELAILRQLKRMLSTANVFDALKAAKRLGLKPLLDDTLSFIDRHPKQILACQALSELPVDTFEETISREAFQTHLFGIFHGVRRWYAAQKEHVRPEKLKQILNQISQSCYGFKQLVGPVLNAHLSDFDECFASIIVPPEFPTVTGDSDGTLIVNENVATMDHGARVVTGKNKSALLQASPYADKRQCTFHNVEETDGITVELNDNFVINHIILELPDKCPYSHYTVKVSTDSRDWLSVVDYTKYKCRGTQKLHFAARAVRYIRVIGMRTQIHKQFRLVAFAAMYTTELLDTIHGICVPRNNVATSEHGAKLIAGASVLPSSLLEGAFGKTKAFTHHQIGSGSIQIQLAQPYIIDSLEFDLYCPDNRRYSYDVETSLDGSRWEPVEHRASMACKGRQALAFRRRPVIFVKIVGTHNTMGDLFQIRHFECPSPSGPTRKSKGRVGDIWYLKSHRYLNETCFYWTPGV